MKKTNECKVRIKAGILFTNNLLGLVQRQNPDPCLSKCGAFSERVVTMAATIWC